VGLLALALLIGVAAPVLAAEAAGKIKSVDATKNTIVVTDTNQKDWTFTLTKDAKIFVNDKEGKIADLQKDHEVTVKYEKDNTGNMNAMEVRAKAKT
jgi:hypothetical protein